MKRATRATAYHEAGHAVAAYHQRISVDRATIVRRGDVAGSCDHGNPLRGRDIECDDGNANRLRMERLVIVGLAGIEAQRRFDRRSVRRHHASHDFHQAVDLVSYFDASPAGIEAYLNLLTLWTRGLLGKPFVWDQVRAVAETLLVEHTIGGRRLRKIIRAAGESAFQRHLAGTRLRAAQNTEK